MISGPERIFTLAFVPVVAISIAGMLLAEAGWFRTPALAAAALVFTVLGWAVVMREGDGREDRAAEMTRRATASLAAILSVAAVLVVRPGEYLSEGHDASVYVAIGHSIARDGSIVTLDPLLDGLQPDVRDSLFPRDRGWPPLQSRFAGGIQIADRGSRIVPSFFHLLPVWIAAFVVVAGPQAGFYVNAAFALGAVAALFLLGRRLSSALAGGVAAALLTINFGQIWYARLQSSEMPAQFFVLSGLLFTVLALDGRSRVAAALAGVAFGLSALARIDALALTIPIVAIWLVLARRSFQTIGPGEGGWRCYLAALAFVTGHAVVHALTLAAPYTFAILSSVTGALAGAGAAGSRSGVPVRASFVAGDIALLLTPAGVLAALAGLVVFLRRKPGAREILPVALFAVHAIAYVAWGERVSLPWDFRRHVPVVLPMALLFTGCLSAALIGARSRWRAAGWILPVALGALFLWRAWPVVSMPPMRGVYSAVRAIADQVPPDAVIIADHSIPGHVPMALQFVFGRRAVRLSNRRADRGAVPPLVVHALERGHPVYVLIARYQGDMPELLWRADLRDLALDPIAAAPLRFVALAESSDGMPNQLRTIDVPLELYRARPSGAPVRPLVPPVTIDIGGMDFEYLWRGFHGAEMLGSATARWTRGEADVLLPAVGPRARTLVFRLSGDRPPGAPPARVECLVDGAAIGVLPDLQTGFGVYRVSLPEPASAAIARGGAVLTLQTRPFVPSRSGASRDDRELGISIDWITIE